MQGAIGDVDFLTLLQYGATGFAVILLSLGYRLLNQLMNAKDKGDNFKRKLFAVVFFMSISTIFFFGGLAGQYILQQQERPVNVLITPNQMPAGVDRPQIRRGVESIKLENGAAVVAVKYNDTLNFQVECLTDRILMCQQAQRYAPTMNQTLQ